MATIYPGMHQGILSPMIFNLLLQLLILIAFSIVVWWVVKNNKTPRIRERPIDILKKRLAAGEINIKEYEKLKKELE